MKRTLTRWTALLFFVFATNSMQLACSSSDESTEEEVVASENGNAADANEEGQAAENENENEGNSAESGNFANNEGGNNAGINPDAEGTNAVADNGGQGGEQDLQQIIEEMNGANSNPQAGKDGSQQGFDNVGGGLPQEQGAVENLAADGGGMPAAEPAPMSSGPAAVGTPAGAGLPELGSKMVYIVMKGDTLAKIAQRIYGDGNKWTEIANFTGLANPKLIYPGDVVYYQLTEQSMSFAGVYEGMKKNEVQVSQGDTMATIAGRVLGNSTLWKLIWRQNDRIDNPDRLTAGTTLYYLDPEKVARMETESGKIVQSTDKGQNNLPKTSTVTKVKVAKSVVFEVANDQLDDFFSQVKTNDFLQRSMI